MAAILITRLCGEQGIRLVNLRSAAKNFKFHNTVRNYARDAKETWRTVQKPTLKERAMAPAGEGGEY